MPIRRSESDVEGLVTSPPSTVLEEVIDAARRGYCQLYSTSPSWTLAKNTFILPIVTRTLDRFCGDYPPPPPPPPPNFTGGQCTDLYVISVFFNIQPTGGGAVIPSNAVVAANRLGAILSLTPSQPDGLDSLTTTAIYDSGNQTDDFTFGPIANGDILIDSVTYQVQNQNDPLDACGNPPPPPYPELPPPTVEERTINVNVTNVNNETNNYTGIINNSFDGQTTFPPTINISGVAVSIDIGGVSISNETNRTSGGGGGDGSQNVTNDTEPPSEITKTEELPEESNPPPKTVENLVAITISASGSGDTFPSTGGRGGPDVFYIGWVEFKNKGFYYPREYIHFKNTRFQAPEENDGYAITYKKGWSGTVTEIVENVESA